MPRAGDATVASDDTFDLGGRGSKSAHVLSLADKNVNEALTMGAP